MALLISYALAAFASPVDTVLFDNMQEDYDKRIHSIAAVEDTLYLMNNTAVLAYHAGDEVPTPIYQGEMERGMSYSARIVSDGKALYLLSLPDETLYLIQDGVLTAPQKLDLSLLKEEDYGLLSVIQLVLEEDALLVLQRSDTASPRTFMALLRIPRDGTGAAILPNADVFSITPYEPGKLLCSAINPTAQGVNDFLELIVLHAKNGTILERRGFLPGSSGNDLSIGYDREQARTFLHDGSTIQRMEPDGTFTVVNYLNANGYFPDATVLSNEAFVLYTNDGVYIRSTNETQLSKKPLVIQGYLFDEELIKAFEKEYPDIPIILRSEEQTAEDIADRLRTGESTVDLYALSAAGGFNHLLQKGYFQDLSGSEKLMDTVGKMYPAVQEAVASEGKLNGYPIGLWVSNWLVRMDLLEEFDLTLPASYLEYIDLYMDWYAQGAQDNTDIMFTRDFGERIDLLYNVLELYEMTYGVKGQPISFDHPDVRAAIAKILTLAPGQHEDMEGVRYYSSSTADKVIFDTWGSIPIENPERYNAPGRYEIIAPPPFAQDAPQQLPAILQVLALNPHSGQQANAVTFLEFAMEHAKASDRYLLRPDLNDPVPDEMYTQEEAEVLETIRTLEEDLTKAKETDRGALTDELASARDYLQFVQTQKWRIRAEEITNYRALAPLLNLRLDSQFAQSQSAQAGEQIKQIFGRMLKGHISTDQAIAELNQKMRMMFLEQ